MNNICVSNCISLVTEINNNLLPLVQIIKNYWGKTIILMIFLEQVMLKYCRPKNLRDISHIVMLQ